MVRLTVIAALCAMGLGTVGAEARDIREERVHFPADHDAVLIQDRIVGYESVSYHVQGVAGETMTVALTPSNTATYFNVYAPGRGPGEQALANASIIGGVVPDVNRFQGELPETGDYIISVYLYRSAARRDEVSSYTLEIEVSGAAELAAEAAAESPTPTDMRGPEFWVVDVDTRLRLHAAPSTNAPIVAHASDGTAVRNLGCWRGEDRTWCKVERPGGDDRGWAAAEYLRGETGAFAASGTEYEPFGHESGWNILVRDDMNRGCVAETTRDGVQIQIGVDRRDNSSYLAIFTRERTGIVDGEHLAVQFDLDGDRFIGDAITETRAGFEGGYIHVTSPRFLIDLIEKQTLTVMPAGQSAFQIDLTGSKAAISKMIECQFHQG